MLAWRRLKICWQVVANVTTKRQACPIDDRHFARERLAERNGLRKSACRGNPLPSRQQQQQAINRRHDHDQTIDSENGYRDLWPNNREE